MPVIEPAEQVLREAAATATAAPSIFNTQPGDDDLLATITLSGPHRPGPAELSQARAVRHRRTDRRAFSPDPVPPKTAGELVNAAESEGAHLHLVHRDDIATLALAAVKAGAIQLADRDYRLELIRWTHRPPWSGDGVPTATAVEVAPRAVPVRDFAPYGGPVLDAGPYTDRGALYGIVFTEGDSSMAWLRAGEALSAVLLTATAAGLATAPISDVTELAVTRQQLHHILSGVGVPQLAVRIGHPPRRHGPRDATPNLSPHGAQRIDTSQATG